MPTARFPTDSNNRPPPPTTTTTSTSTPQSPCQPPLTCKRNVPSTGAVKWARQFASPWPRKVSSTFCVESILLPPALHHPSSSLFSSSLTPDTSSPHTHALPHALALCRSALFVHAWHGPMVVVQRPAPFTHTPSTQGGDGESMALRAVPFLSSGLSLSLELWGYPHARACPASPTPS